MESTQHSQNNRGFSINICRCRHELPLLKELLKANNWEEVYLRDKYADMIWLQASAKEENIEKIKQTKAIYNRLLGLQIVSNKYRLSKIFDLYYSLYESAFNFAPKTFGLQNDKQRLKDYMENNKKLNKNYIAKPQDGAEGCGIFLIQHYKDLPAFSFQQNYIVQEYLSNPLLINKKKFDLRIYILVLSINPIIAYIHEEALVRFCTEDYQKPDKENMHKLLGHLTNYSLNKNSQNYVNCQDLQDQENSTKRTMTSLMDQLKELGIDTDYLFEQIKEACTKALIAIQPFVLQEQETQINMAKAKGDCFQILGFDVFIDDKLKAWIFEINDHPSLNINLEKEGEKGLIKEPSEIDKYIKMKVLGDGIKLMKNRNIQRESIDKYKGWIRILPSAEFDDYDAVIKAKQIFDYLVNKQGGNLNLTKFSKLYKIKPLNNNGQIMKASFEILFKKITSRYNSQLLTLEMFFETLQELGYMIRPTDLDSLDFVLNSIINSI